MTGKTVIFPGFPGALGTLMETLTLVELYQKILECVSDF